MIARIGEIKTQPGTAAEGSNRVNEIVVPALKGAKGFKNFYVMADNKTGKGYSLTIWESEADLQAWVNSEEGKKVASRMIEAGSPKMNWETFEVTVNL